MNQFRDTRLTDGEHAEMRARVRLFMAEHPVQPTMFERFFARRPSSRRSYFQPALASFLILVLVGSGTSYVAADALPGDLLYGIKTEVNESLVGALAVSESAKASWNATLAARRLEEAGTLALQGRLSEDTRAIIEERFEEHSAQFDANVAALAIVDEHIEIAADAQSYMEVSLQAHADVLTEVAGVAPEVGGELRAIVEKVRSRAGDVESARIATEEIIAAKVGGKILAVVEAKKRIIEHEVEDEDGRASRADVRQAGNSAARTKVAATPPEVEPTAMTLSVAAPDLAATMEMSLSAEADLRESDDDDRDETREALRDGSEKLEEGKHGEAFAAFQKALRSVEKKKLDTDVRKRLKLNVTPLKNDGPDTDNDEGDEEAGSLNESFFQR